MPSTLAISAWVWCRSRRSCRSCGPTKVLAMAGRFTKLQKSNRCLKTYNTLTRKEKNCAIWCVSPVAERAKKAATREGNRPQTGRRDDDSQNINPWFVLGVRVQHQPLEGGPGRPPGLPRRHGRVDQHPWHRGLAPAQGRTRPPPLPLDRPLRAPRCQNTGDGRSV